MYLKVSLFPLSVPENINYFCQFLFFLKYSINNFLTNKPKKSFQIFLAQIVEWAAITNCRLYFFFVDN
jgi:hypothetical protein